MLILEVHDSESPKQGPHFVCAFASDLDGYESEIYLFVDGFREVLVEISFNKTSSFQEQALFIGVLAAVDFFSFDLSVKVLLVFVL